MRLAFDGLRFSSSQGKWRVDGLAAHPVRTRPAAWNDDADGGQFLWGFYASRSNEGELSMDLYYLGLHRRSATFAQGTAEERRHSFGTRFAQTRARADYDIELVYQLGTFGTGLIRAWTLASDIGWRLDDTPWTPRLGLKVDITSGDRNPADPDLQTFNALFPRGAYFGEAALVGPANHIDLHPSITLTPRSNLKVQLDWFRFWRESRADGLYGPAMNLQFDPGGAQSRKVGQQLEVKVVWTVTRKLTLTADAAHFGGSRFLAESSRAEDVDYLSVWGTLRF